MSGFLDNMWSGTELGGPDIGNGNYYRGSPDQIVAAEQQTAKKRQDDTERLRRAQQIADHDFTLKKRELDIKRDTLAVQKGQAKAEQWYQQQLVQLSKDRLEQEARIHGEDLSEQRRQFDITSGEQKRQYDLTSAEQKREFGITSSGYLENGKATFAREQWQNSSLFDWTRQAIDLASRPQDWVKYKQYTSGVGANIGSIPGLNWAAGGQVGNTTAAGDHPTNSLQNVMGNMGVNAGQGGAQASGPAPATAAWGGNWASQAAQSADQIAHTPVSMTDQEKQLYSTANDFASNPQGASSDWWDQQDPMTKQLLQGAAEAQGHDWSTVMARYQRSRWGGGGSSMAA